MYKVLCVSNASLCQGDFLTQIKAIAQAGVDGIILREKDLSKEDYKALAKEVLEICEKENVLCMLHSFYDVAISLSAKAIHLPLPILRQMTKEEKKGFSILGASCHSVEEAWEAEKLGCTYITAGHVFPTDCKKGIPPRGLVFLQEVCKEISIPVYALGGIDSKNALSACKQGAKGICLMSGFMVCENPSAYLKEIQENLRK